MKEKLKDIGKEIGAFFSSSVVLKNLGLLLFTVVALLYVTSGLLKACTRHGESLQVKEYVGMDLRDAMRQAKRDDFRIMVNDSIDRGSKPPNQIVSQNPKAFSRVKKNRTIYLVVTRQNREKIPTPKITGSDEFDRYAKLLKRREINAVIREKVTNQRYAPNTILEVYHKQGGEDKKLSFKELDQGYQIEKGSTLEFVVTEYGTQNVELPFVVCKTYGQAENLIQRAKLVVGNVQEDVTVVDRETAYVYKMMPEYDPAQPVRVGQQIDLFLTQSLPEECGGSGINGDDL